MKARKTWEKDGFILRAPENEEAEKYFEENFQPLDAEIIRLTGAKKHFTQEEVISFFHKSISDDDRYFFLIVSPDGRIIGETVINEINFDLRSANFRIAIFSATEREKGLGTWAVQCTRDFAFEELKLHRLELEVFDFNPRAEKCYLRAGFIPEGRLRDRIKNGNHYANVIPMAILEDDWRTIKEQERKEN